MLSHQTSKPTTTDDQRQHQRQQSTPTVLEANQLPLYHATHQFSGSHRRGMSLDQPVAHIRQHYPQDQRLIGITNTGHSQQHYLQEAQQHSQARPGLQQPNNHSLQLSEQEFRNLQHQQLDARIDTLFHNNISHSLNNGQHAVKIERSRSHPEAYHGMNLATPPHHSAHGSPVQGLMDPQSDGAYITRQARNGHPVMQNWTPQQQRPYTPQNQSNNAQIPLTPSASPYHGYGPLVGQSENMKRTGSQEIDMNATIRAGRSPVKQAPQPSHTFVHANLAPGQINPNTTINAHIRPAVLQDLSNADLFHSGHMEMSPEVLQPSGHTAPLRPELNGFDVAFMSSEHPLQLAYSPSASETLFDSAQTSPQMSPTHGSPEMRKQYSQRSPIHGSPDIGHEQFRGDVSAMVPLQHQSGGSSPTHTARSSIDFDLLDSPTRDMSIADLNLDATIEDTGISMEEIQAYISQPDPETGKWVCLYPECGKTFGRKENVRAHVQTHLGDRQFRCIHCGKCFVRQHDLKRHSKTHSGVKPYPCRCGNSFARHDALTRHRQRGICPGGFEGVVKKMVKRGRPKKERPSRDERLDKAARTRKRAAAKSYASSVSGGSESSVPESPTYFLEGVDFEPSKDGGLQNLLSRPFTLDPEVLNFSGPPSPYSTEDAQSPRKPRSATSGHTPKSTSFEDDRTAAIFGSMNVTDQTTRSNVGSQVGSPPELSHSSPPSSTRLLDFDLGTNFNSGGPGLDGGMNFDTQTTNFESLTLHMANSPDAMFTSPWNENTFFNFDKETSGGSGSMFTNSFDDDIMFSESCETGDGFF